MADLSALIRLHKHELDEKRRALGVLYAGMTDLERARSDLEHAFEREKEAVAKAGDISFTFAQYVEKVRQQNKEFERQAVELEKQIRASKDSLLETFSELKKYEMTQQERDRLAEEERLFKESQEMDAIGIEGFRRKGEE